MAECFSCMSPRLGKEELKQPTFHDDTQTDLDHRDEEEQITATDGTRENPSPSKQSSMLVTPPVTQSSVQQSTEAAPANKEKEDSKSKHDAILRKLGILYLDDKVTRARVHETETDETILRDAGISIIEAPEFKEEQQKKLKNEKKQEFIDKISKKSMSHRDKVILKESGVLNLDTPIDAPLPNEEKHGKILSEKKSALVTFSQSTLGSGSLNSSYADRKLQRRLKKGWTTTGRECVCGMPVISNKAKGSYECVICGVVDDDKYQDEVDDIFQVESHMVGGSPGVFLLDSDTNMSSLPSSMDYTDEASEEALRQELGNYLFHGWVLLGTTCPMCGSLPLIGNTSDTSDAPPVCVRCG